MYLTSLYLQLVLGLNQMCFAHKVTSINVDIARVSPEYHLYTESEVEDVLTRL